MKLAIKGHEKRGAEVIAILEMLGGRNLKKLEGINPKYYYTIDNDGTISGIISVYNHVCYTIEEFLEKFPYKVGDKVQGKGSTSCDTVYEIVKIGWNDNQVEYTVGDLYWKSLKYTETAENLQPYKPYKEETMNRRYNVEDYLKVWDAAEKGLEVFVNDNFELKEDNGKFYIVKKQPQYPKTYKECCEVLMGKTDFQDFELVLTKLSITQAQNSTNIFPSVPPHITLINNFYKLLICRDAYWRMAGEQMGLVKPWKPDWTEGSQQKKYCIYKECSNIKKGVLYSANITLAFPTEEIRDVFFENFKELIEECKELL